MSALKMIQIKNINLNNQTLTPLLKEKLQKQGYFSNTSAKDEIKITNTKTNELEIIKQNFEKIKKQQGLTGKFWDTIKNLFHLKTGSKFVEQSIKEYSEGKIAKEKVLEILDKYHEGQNISVDIMANIISGIASVGIFSLAASSFSLPVAMLLSFSTGAVTKVGSKLFSAKTNNREYNNRNMQYDILTGGVNGLLAPIANGLGSTLEKVAASKLGLEISKDVAKNSTKSIFKTMLMNQNVEIIGKNSAKKALAVGAGMLAGSALSGAADNATRGALEGQDSHNILKSAQNGLLGGLILAPIIGGGFKLAVKLGKVIKNK